MNDVDKEYRRLVNLVLDTGKVKKNRTGIDTISVFGAQSKFTIDLDAFPILTTKKVFFKGIVHELLWFLSGDTNIKYLVDNDVHIWDEWAYKKYHDIHQVNDTIENDRWMKVNPTHPIVGDTVSMFTQSEFVDNIKTKPEWLQWGELGKGTYGGMWRDFPVDNVKKGRHTLGVDQIEKVIGQLINNPDDRRMIVSTWHPYWVDHCVLPPCHCMFHFNTEELSLPERYIAFQKMGFDAQCAYDTWPKLLYNEHEKLDEFKVPRRRLNCLLYQRSCDLGLGIPFNITSYCLLTAMLAHCVGMVPGIFTHTYGDLHIYSNHIDSLKEQIKLLGYALPQLKLNPSKRYLFDISYDDIKLEGYISHPSIKMDIAV